MARRDVPEGFGSYSRVLERICEYRPAGKWVQFQCVLPHRHKNGDAHWSGLAWIGDRGELVARCRGCGAGFRELVDAVGLPQTEWFADKGKAFALRREFAGREFSKIRNNSCGRATTPPDTTMAHDPIATYDYCDEGGRLLWQKLRYEPKRFALRRPTDPDTRRRAEIPADVESWVWGVSDGVYSRPSKVGVWDLVPCRDDHQIAVKIDVCRKVLYRLPDLLGANPDHPVFVVEGEKDAETLRALGMVATCTPNGSASLDPEWLVPLVGRRVVVAADNDGPGLMHAKRVVGTLVCGGVRAVRVLWPGECGYDVGAGGDLSDWLATRGKLELVALCKNAREYK